MKDKLKDLLRDWQVRQDEYIKSMVAVLRNAGNTHDRNRYEGIATGTRWCIEDLKKLLETNEP